MIWHDEDGKPHGCGVYALPDGGFARVTYDFRMPLSDVRKATTERAIKMSKDEQAIEKEIQSKGLNAPRLNPAMIDGAILAEQFFVFPGTTMTVCCLTLRNGFQVIGESAAASPENFDEEIGRKIARENARNKIWALEGYLLKQRLHEQRTA